jgi:hypothetical protein
MPPLEWLPLIGWKWSNNIPPSLGSASGQSRRYRARPTYCRARTHL